MFSRSLSINSKHDNDEILEILKVEIVHIFTGNSVVSSLKKDSSQILLGASLSIKGH